MHERHSRTIGHGLMLVAAMLGLIAAALWLRPASLEPQAYARAFGTDNESRGIPDAGLQRQHMLKELRSVNERLGRLESGLKNGTFRVEVVSPEGSAATAGGAVEN